MSDWHAVATTDEIAPGEVKRVEVGDVELGVYNLDGEFYAISDVCSHEYSRLSEGEVYPEEGIIECAMHGAQFDIRTGENLCFPAPTPVQKYETRVSDGTIEVLVP